MTLGSWKKEMVNSDLTHKHWFKLLVLTSLAVYLYIFMEWIFFTTKPSFMSLMELPQKLTIFFLSAFVLTIPLLALAGCTLFLFKWCKISWILAIVPALLFTFLSLILFDNFTYTVFEFGVVTSQGVWRVVYAAALIAIFMYYLKSISKHLQSRSNGAMSFLAYLMLFLFSLSAVIFVGGIRGSRLNLAGNNSQAPSISNMPNIILVGWDGVNATHLSVYGYEKENTPHLQRLVSNGLLIENAFSNAGKTGGSLTSLLTGKYSTETRVVFPPDILLNEDAYQHLPGILKQMGYSTVQISMPYYGDAYERNIREGFDAVNFRAENANPLLGQFAKMGGSGSFYFSGQVIVRITERLAHIFLIREMENPYAALTEPVLATHDNERLQSMFDTLDQTEGPLFLHVHMMDMHGPKFYVPRQVFSAGQTQRTEWMMDFYDDSILNSDHYLNELFNHLSETGELQNTMVILYSDHGMKWDPLVRVPLIFWFPGGQYAGRIGENVQLIDVAPTILDYLGVSQPVWMQGRSILTDDLPAARPIFSANVGEDQLMLSEDRTIWMVDERKISAPFYQLGAVNLVMCDQWFSLNLQEPQLVHGDVQGSTASCPQADIPSLEDATKLLLQHLFDAHYDISNFPAEIPFKSRQ
jgi:hypothetical protein